MTSAVTDGEPATVNTPGDGFLALRSEPSTQRGRRLLKIPHGTVLTLERCVAAAGNDAWFQANYANKNGWVFDRYVLRDTGPRDQAILQAVAYACRAGSCIASVERASSR